MTKLDNAKRNKEIIRLHAVEKLSYRRIASMFGCNVGVVSGAIFRSRRQPRGVPKRVAHKLDLHGLRFGRLTAIDQTEDRAGGYLVWNCKCDCGNHCLVTSRCLAQGYTKSCGCLRRDMAKIAARKTA